MDPNQENYAFNTGDEALAHLRQFGSQPMGEWFKRWLQNPSMAAAAQRPGQLEAAGQMTAQAPAMEASDPVALQEQDRLAQLAQQQAAQLAQQQADNEMQQPANAQLPPTGENQFFAELAGGSPPPSGGAPPVRQSAPPSPPKAPQAPTPAKTPAAPTSPKGPKVSGADAIRSRQPNTGSSNSFLSFFSTLFGIPGGGADWAGRMMGGAPGRGFGGGPGTVSAESPRSGAIPLPPEAEDEDVQGLPSGGADVIRSRRPGGISGQAYRDPRAYYEDMKRRYGR